MTPPSGEGPGQKVASPAGDRAACPGLSLDATKLADCRKKKRIRGLLESEHLNNVTIKTQILVLRRSVVLRRSMWYSGITPKSWYYAEACNE